jgi:hypothetical protein
MVNCYLDMRAVLDEPQARPQMQFGRKKRKNLAAASLYSKKLRVKNAGCYENSVDEPAEF